MLKRSPQVFPTRKARGLFETSLRLLERVPLIRDMTASQQEVSWSDVPLSIVIPLHPKDFWIASYAVKYARRNVRHPVEEVIVISRRSDLILDWVKKEGLRWVDEDSVLRFSKNEVEAQLPEHASLRSSWIFQQLLKFSVDDIVKTDAFLILDADTLLLAPRVFKKDETIWMDYSHERNMLYLKSYNYLLGEKASVFISFVCHHMFAEKQILQALKKKIESQTGKLWDQAIINLASLDLWALKEKETRPFNYFSEYETYGNFAQGWYSDVRTRYFRNHAAKEYDPNGASPDEYVAALPKFFRWASFHSYHGYKGAEVSGQISAGEKQTLTE